MAGTAFAPALEPRLAGLAAPPPAAGEGALWAVTTYLIDRKD